ncbi:hypothetical protein TRICI_005138 [Trichomonascus ciferrii]|uniref:Condensation domain-containing protein n=1 Tax=Trichomonascus ciferrii TaxID=44093 RepID=A0A642V2N2_9ASCO|nr:hypothetical protein TRICI_005138 [Trichomonascus ciferrii]
MEWKEVSKGRWERPSDGMETYFALVASLTAASSGRVQFMIYSTASVDLKLDDVVGSLKKAWIQMRHSQPHLATVWEEEKLVYEVPDASALSEWLDATFIVADEVKNSDDLSKSVKSIKQPTLYYLPQSSELVLRCHHHLLDGTGAFLFWHCFFTALENPKDVVFGDEYKRLAPSLEHIMGFSKTPSQEVCERAEKIFMGWLTNVPAIGPPNSAGETTPKQPRREQLVVSRQTTDALIKACKEKGVTVTSAIHAASILTTVKYADPSTKQSEYISLCQFNLRDFLPAPYNSADYAVSLYYSAMPYNIDLPASFWDLAKNLNNYYQTTFKAHPEMLEIKCEMTRVLTRTFQTPQAQNAPVPKDPLISSMGIVERFVQRNYGETITVKDISFGSECVEGMASLYIYTFRDQLRMVYSFNDGFQDPKDIQTYLQEILNVLTKELSLPC